MPSPTPPIRTEDRPLVEALLRENPVTTAVTWNRAFDMEGPKELYIDGDRPKGVLAVVRPPWSEGATGVAMHAVDPKAAESLMPAWPGGAVFLQLGEEWRLPFVEARAASFDDGVFWLFQLDPNDFVDQEGPRVQPLDPKWGDMVGKIWDPDWNLAGSYVRSRIEAGHAYAVYEDGTPVAWAFPHFETATVSMMGFLHVLEPYRRKGYAKSVASALAKDILSRQKIPALHVKTDNVASLELTASLGFHRVKKQVWGDAVSR